MFQKNMELQLQIEDMSVNGEGIGKADGVAFFVKDAVIGDQVLVKIIKMKKRYGYARLLKILSPSMYRVEPLCKYWRQCGGCQIQALDYMQQLHYKEEKVRNNLRRIGGFSIADTEKKEQGILFHPIIGMEKPFFYRNKAQFPIGMDKNGKIVTGFYAARSHNIIASRYCYLGVEINEKILDIVISFMEKHHISAYDERTGKGLVRHILIRFGFVTKEIMVCLVVNGNNLPHAELLIEALKELEGMTSIVLNINQKNTNVILGEKLLNLWGQDYITDYIGEVKYQISPLSFYQVNPIQTKKLYQTVLNYAMLTGKETVWDLYCGIGTISLFLAQRAKKVYGVEIVAPAIADARNNAKINGIENVKFFVGKAEEILPAFYENYVKETENDIKDMELQSGTELYGNQIETDISDTEFRLQPGTELYENQVEIDINGTAEERKISQPDVVVVDPPRKGCDPKCLETIVKISPARVVYVSCDSATLARDLKYLCERGYEVRAVQPVDMFPQTVHVETVCLLSKLHSDQHIEVELQMDELDLTAAESKATYEEIKDYVLEHSGLKVSSLYIAQVKEKCGIIERVNYNLPKSENSRQPKCPPEKEVAIREALEYFHMI